MRRLLFPIHLPSWRQIVGETLFLAAYCFLFLLVFQPFGTYEYTHADKAMQLAGYGLLVLILHPLLRKLLLLWAQRRSSSYHIGMEAVLLAGTLLALCFSAFLYHAWIIAGRLDWGHVWVFMLYGMAIGVLPFGFLLYHRWRQYENQARPPVAEGSVFVPQASVAPPTAPEELLISGVNRDECFSFLAKDVYYLKASGNYVEIFFLKEGRLKSELVRNTLRNLSSQLAEAGFVGIHRSYLVNIKLFDRLTREEGRYKLQSTMPEVCLQVSRKFVPMLKGLLKDHR